MDAAGFLKFLLTLPLLLRDKLGHKGVMAYGVGLVDTGGDLREVCVLHHHQLVHAYQVPLPCTIVPDSINKVCRTA